MPEKEPMELDVLITTLVLVAWIWHSLSRFAPDLRKYFYLIYLNGLNFYFVRHGAGHFNNLRFLKQLCNVAIDSSILLLKKLRLKKNRLAQCHKAVHGRPDQDSKASGSKVCTLSTTFPRHLLLPPGTHPPNTKPLPTHLHMHAHTPTPWKGTYLYFWPVFQVKSSCI